MVRRTPDPRAGSVLPLLGHSPNLQWRQILYLLLFRVAMDSTCHIGAMKSSYMEALDAPVRLRNESCSLHIYLNHVWRPSTVYLQKVGLNEVWWRLRYINKYIKYLTLCRVRVYWSDSKYLCQRPTWRCLHVSMSVIPVAVYDPYDDWTLKEARLHNKNLLLIVSLCLHWIRLSL